MALSANAQRLILHFDVTGVSAGVYHYHSTAHALEALDVDPLDAEQPTSSWLHPWTEPWRWRLIAELAAQANASAHVTTTATVRGLGAEAAAAGVTVGVRLQLGTGEDVTAVPDGELLAMAAAVSAEPALRFDGVTAYRGLVTAAEASHRADVGRAAARYAVRVADEIRRAGLPCPGVTVGGTPTAEGALSVQGVTEICAGAYALWDAGQAAIGACAPQDIALHAACVTVYDAADGRPVGQWKVLNEQDAPPGGRQYAEVS